MPVATQLWGVLVEQKCPLHALEVVDEFREAGDHVHDAGVLLVALGTGVVEFLEDFVEHLVVRAGGLGLDEDVAVGLVAVLLRV